MQLVITLKHKATLKYRESVENKKLLKLINAKADCVFTFDNLGVAGEILEVDALDIPHIFKIQESQDIAVLNLESHSPLHPIIYWYLLHQLNVGRTIQIVEENTEDLYIEREYFRSSFELTSINGISRIYRKIKPLLVETSKGLDDWSFCIPTGPGDASLLNNLVRQILEFEIPKKEILLCGRPGENFLYWDDVRIVGEDIPAPPVHITKKKNVLAQESKYQNLCILHDRVLLPCNFVEAIQKMGDLYPVTTFQSIYMVDRLGLLPMRYSDLNCLLESIEKNDSEVFQKDIFKTEIHNARFLYYTPNMHPINSYATGSLYIVKKELWMKSQQEEELYWAEFEDVEFGLRLNKYGVPTIANPFSLSFSQRGRPAVIGQYLLNFFQGETAKARTSIISRSALLLLPLKSVLGDVKAYKKNIDLYIDKYSVAYTCEFPKKTTAKWRFKLISDLVFLTPIIRTRSFFQKWYKDICKYLILEQTFDLESYDLERAFLDNKFSNYSVKLYLINHLYGLQVQMFQSLFAPVFKKRTNGGLSRVNKHRIIYSHLTSSRILNSKDFALKVDKKELSWVITSFMRVSNGN